LGQNLELRVTGYEARIFMTTLSSSVMRNEILFPCKRPSK